MTTKPCLRIAFVTALVSLGLMPMSTASASSAPSGQLTYSCVTDTSVISSDTPVTFTMDSLPSKVTAGTSVTLGGTLAVSLPSADTLAPQLGGGKSMGVQSSSFGIQLGLAGKQSVLVNSVSVGSPVPIASPTVVRASVTFPALAIPKNAYGELVISMPTAADVAHQVASAPAKVVFGAVLNQDSLLASEQKLDCSAPGNGQEVVIARIPIAPAPPNTPTGAGSGSTGSPAPIPAPAGPAASVASPLSIAAPSSTPVTRAPVAATAPTASAASVATLANAPIPPQTVGKGTFIPAWSLVLSGALIPAAFILYAANQRKKLQRLITSQGL